MEVTRLQQAKQLLGVENTRFPPRGVGAGARRDLGPANATPK